MAPRVLYAKLSGGQIQGEYEDMSLTLYCTDLFIVYEVLSIILGRKVTYGNHAYHYQRVLTLPLRGNKRNSTY